MNMKSFEPQPWVAPQPVLIIGTYNEDGSANAMNAAWGGQWDMKEIIWQRTANPLWRRCTSSVTIPFTMAIWNSAAESVTLSQTARS